MRGIIPPVVTLIDENGKPDLAKNKQMLDKIIEAGVHGLVLLGSSGEFPHFTMQEKKDYLNEIIPYLRGKLPVLVGTGGVILEETIELTLFVERLGADGVLVVNPFYWNLSDEQIYVYYAELAKAVNIDIYLYNIPQLTGQEIPVCVIEKLAKDFDNIRGIKETVSSISRIRTVINELNSVREDFYVYSAFDEHLLDAQILGAAGSINGTSVFLPELSVRLYEAIHNSDFSQVKKLHIEISNKMELYSWHPSFYISMKEAVYARWFPEESVNLRTPFINNEQDLRSLAKAMIEKSLCSGVYDEKYN
ncbi:dihydrodipicolinate synthase family protein [Lysinibacillus sp. PLM2]|nr:dihydrodipicolinate synthase family protein [Lysinibacillus sp. PLM2]